MCHIAHVHMGNSNNKHRVDTSIEKAPMCSPCTPVEPSHPKPVVKHRIAQYKCPDTPTNSPYNSYIQSFEDHMEAATALCMDPRKVKHACENGGLQVGEFLMCYGNKVQ